MTALDVIRDIAEYSRPDFLARIRSDAYRAPNDPADSGAFDAAVDAAADALEADSCANIRRALEMGPTPGPFSVSRCYSAGNQELILRLTYKGEYGLPEHYCTVRSRLGGELEAEANAALIAACDPDTIRELLAERDRLAAALEAAQRGLRYAVMVWVLSDEIKWSEEEIDEAVERIIGDAKKEAVND